MERARGRDCVWLLGALVTLFVLQPYLSALSDLDIPLIRRIDSRMVGVIAYSSVLLVGLRAVSVQRRHLWVGVGLAVPALLLNWATVALPAPPSGIRQLAVLITAGFLAYVGGRLLIYVVSTEQVSRDQLAGAISIYLILGHTWSLVYALIEFRNPGSFNGLGSPDRVGSDLMYFSFVTLTTLGFGDITPKTLEARVFAALEAVFGVIYVATLVSRLVSLYSRRRSI
jgi:hypothetical protein